MTHCFNPPPLHSILKFSYLCFSLWINNKKISHLIPNNFSRILNKFSNNLYPTDCQNQFSAIVLFLSSAFKFSICPRSDWDEAVKLTSFRATHTVTCIAFGGYTSTHSILVVLATAEQGLWSVMVFSLPPPAWEFGRGHSQDSYPNI